MAGCHLNFVLVEKPDKDEARIFGIPPKQLYGTLGLEAIISAAQLFYNHRISALDLLS